MAHIKSYTDIEQSKKLAEILPLENADGFWEYHDKWYSEGDEWEGYEDYPRAEPYLEYTHMENEWKEDKSDVPCWSLAALLNVLPDVHLKKYIYDRITKYYATLIGIRPLNSEHYDNPVDACYEMILKLHEQNLI